MEHQTEISNIKSEYQAVITNLKMDHDVAISDLEAKYDGIITELKVEHRTNIFKLKTDTAQQDSESIEFLTNLKNDTEKNLAELDAKILKAQQIGELNANIEAKDLE